MSLTSSMFSGVSGLSALGNAMQVVSDNIANVSTLGFKSGAVTFQDLLSQSMATLAGTSQVGRGTGMGEISASFSQGSFENTGNATDLAIGGEGFFILNKKESDELYYSRAGNFSFNNDGYLVNPQGLAVKGWEMDDSGNDVGSIKDVQLKSFTSAPEKTTKVSMITNLDSTALSKTPVLAAVWDSSVSTPIDKNSYQYQSIIKVYDSLGSTHDLTVYYNKKSGSIWEYMITANPNEDLRNLTQNTNSKGLLAKGLITFGDSSGKIQDITMQKFTGIIGDINTSGSITKDNVTFGINDYTGLDGDGYGFKLEYTGTGTGTNKTGWTLNGATQLPLNYRNATIMTQSGSEYTTEKQVLLDTNGDSKLDMIVKLDKTAQVSDAVTFDINSPIKLHVRNVDNVLYTGDALGDNAKMTIDNPDALTRDVKKMQLKWNNNHIDITGYSNDFNIVGAPVGDITSKATTMVINNNNIPSPAITGTSTMALSYIAATGTWNLTTSVYTAASIAITSTTTGITIDLGNNGTKDLTFNFSNLSSIINNSEVEFAIRDSKLQSRVVATELTPSNIAKDTITPATPYTLKWDGTTWDWKKLSYVAGSPSGDITSKTTTTVINNSNIPSPAITGTSTMALSYIAATGTWNLTTSVYTAASIAITSTATGITIDLGNNGTKDLTFNFSNLTSIVNNSEMEFAIVGRSPLDDGYGSEKIITAQNNKVIVALNKDTESDLQFDFPSGGPNGTNSEFTFSIDKTKTAAWEMIKPQVVTESYRKNDQDKTKLSVTQTISDPKALYKLGIESKDRKPYNLMWDGTKWDWKTYDTDGTTVINGHKPSDDDSVNYKNSIIDNSATKVSMDFDGDGFADLTYTMDTAAPNGATLDFTIENVYKGMPDPTGDKDKVTLNIDNDINKAADLTFAFNSSLRADTTMTFDMIGTTAWANQSKTKDIDSNGYYQFDADFIGGKDNTSMKIEFDIGSKYNTDKFVSDSLTTTQYSRSSSTTYQAANGYGAGDLQSIDVASDGEMTGIYSNGQIVSLYRVALAKFQNKQGLYKEGGNLYRETRDSGSALYNKPGTNGLGTIAPNSLEQSNVDIANEFVKMITNQRGFQANSKIITTVDSMLTEAINMKR